MYQHIRQINKEARANQVTRLLEKICEENSLRIIPNKVCFSVESINLAWCIAICQKKIETITQVDFCDLGLTPCVEIIHSRILNFIDEGIAKLSLPTDLIERLKMQYINEVELRGSNVVKKTLIYIMPPELGILILKFFSNQREEKNIDEVVDRCLDMNLKDNILAINPNYSGYIFNKTNKPCELILKVMCMMMECGKKSITWSTVIEFIEEHLLGISHRQKKVNLESTEDSNLFLDGCVILKKNGQQNVSVYKKGIFNISKNL